jgi:hypothetical protein
MEHYRSVLATTAVMVFGLVASSPLIREQNSAAPPLQRGAVEASSSGGSEGWTDPPRQKVGLSIVTEAASSRGHTGDRPAPRPASFTLLPPDTAALLASDDFARGEFAKGEAGQRVQAVRRHRAAKVAARPRPAGVEPLATDTPPPAPEAAATPPQKAARIDPIGDILRGLGIGRDS